MGDLQYTDENPAGVPDDTKQVTDEHLTRGLMPIVKLAVSETGNATPIPATEQFGLTVDVKRFSPPSPPTMVIGEIEEDGDKVEITGQVNRNFALIYIDGEFDGDLGCQIEIDGDGTWRSAPIYNYNSGLAQNIDGGGLYFAPMGGATGVRVRGDEGSGLSTVVLVASSAQLPPHAIGLTENGMLVEVTSIQEHTDVNQATTITGEGSVILNELRNKSLVVLTLSGSWTATVVLEAFVCGAWVTLTSYDYSTGLKEETIDNNGTYFAAIGGSVATRVRVATYENGDVGVSITASSAQLPYIVTAP
jgi:hypothetical protein